MHVIRYESTNGLHVIELQLSSAAAERGQLFTQVSPGDGELVYTGRGYSRTTVSRMARRLGLAEVTTAGRPDRGPDGDALPLDAA